MAPPKGKVKAFWNRVTEGQAVSQFWSELTTDARTSYRFYARDIDCESLEGRSKVRRFFRYSGQLFWAIVTKLTPARRVVLLAGLVLLFWPASETHTYGGLLILLVLVLELADRDDETRLGNRTRDTALVGPRRAFLAEFSLDSEHLNHINAGHNAPVLRRASDQTMERLEAGGLPLGIRSDAHYDCGTVNVCPGDLIVLFTDGVIEALNDEEYGEARLLSLLQAAPLGLRTKRWRG